MRVKISLFGLIDMLRFKKLRDRRKEWIDSTPKVPIPRSYPVNDLAREFHPVSQDLVISDIQRLNENVSLFTLKARNPGQKLAPFRAGSFISLTIKVGESRVSRTFSICSSPASTFGDGGYYQFAIQRAPNGFFSRIMVDQAKVGDLVVASDPGGTLNYSRLRDEKRVIALAGGSGITPFISMARAIGDGVEDFDLTLICGFRKVEDILFEDELNEIERRTGKVHHIYVISDEETSDYPRGFITADMVKQASKGEPYSVFAAGPAGFLKYLDTELKPLNLDLKHYRLERSSFARNRDPEASIYTLKVRIEDEIYTCPARSDETVLTALERAGISIRNKCREGACGVCRSKLINGKVSWPDSAKLRMVDREYGYFHPCVSYPQSDLEILVDRYQEAEEK